MDETAQVADVDQDGLRDTLRCEHREAARTPRNGPHGAEFGTVGINLRAPKPE